MRCYAYRVNYKIKRWLERTSPFNCSRKRKADKLYENRCIICTHRWKATSCAHSAFIPRLGIPRDVSAASGITRSMEPAEPAKRWPPPRPISPMPRVLGKIFPGFPPLNIHNTLFYRPSSRTWTSTQNLTSANATNGNDIGMNATRNG